MEAIMITRAAAGTMFSLLLIVIPTLPRSLGTGLLSAIESYLLSYYYYFLLFLFTLPRHTPLTTQHNKIRRWCMLCKELGISSVHGCLPDWQWSESADPTNLQHFPRNALCWNLEIYLLIDWHGTSVIEYWGCGNGILMFSLNPLFRICRECKVSYFQI